MATLCGACRKAFEVAVQCDKWPINPEHHHTFHSLQATASEGCSICAILWELGVSLGVDKQDNCGDARTWSWPAYGAYKGDTSGFKINQLVLQFVNGGTTISIDIYALDGRFHA